MPCVKAKSKYTFCINSPHYNELLEYVKNNKSKGEKIKNINCTSLPTSMTFSENSSAQDICKEFTLLHESISEHSAIVNPKDKKFSPGDCDFLNYWLNDKLRNSVKDVDKIDVRDFYKEIKNKNQQFFSGNEDLETYINNIDPEILKNMELLYDLYDYERKILNMLLNQDYSGENKKPCSFYTKNCYEKYNEAIGRCYGIYDEFYRALKDFKNRYNFSTKQETQDINMCRKSSHFDLPERDPVLEREEKKIMLIQGSTSFLMLILTFPLIYKVKKISLIKD
ncbi:hypothetical protein PVIIG_06141 [Plasmodium vivax India VII]|uniref:PIR Superfamily Protein n=1 Tax=Plasmodium vivax India VII TaxID=1077284 RepID=A0A0J9SJ55_PLAVI|nr:hypothetical protein PVIIG_06141 [Plasmodium vivax India VII]